MIQESFTELASNISAHNASLYARELELKADADAANNAWLESESGMGCWVSACTCFCPSLYVSMFAWICLHLHNWVPSLTLMAHANAACAPAAYRTAVATKESAGEAATYAAGMYRCVGEREGGGRASKARERQEEERIQRRKQLTA